MAGQWDSIEYTRLNELVHDSPLPDLVSAISDHSDRRTLARLLDAELERRERHLRLIREYRNMFSIPIHILPPEVLSHVLFLSACDEDYHTLFTLGWTRLLLVCRRWRDIALSTPSLWSFVSLEPPELVSFPPSTIHNDMILWRVSLQRQRVGSNPMHARIYLNGPRYDDEFFRVYQPFPWITSSLKTLHASGTTSGLSDFLARMVAHDHPLLSHLVVRLIVQESQKPLPSIPGEFLARHVSLRELNVANVHIGFQGLNNLRSLDVLHGYHYNAVIEIDEILDALSRCPTLEFLRLNLPRSATTSSRHSRPAIKLPNLGSVLLQGAYSAITQLLFPLQIPAGSRISFASLEEVHPQDILPLVTYLNAHCCLSSPSVNCIGLNETTSLHSFEMRLYTRSSLENENDPFLIRLSVVAPEPGIRAELAALTLSRLPVRNATLFDIRYMNECHSMVLRSVFERLPSLRTIAVSFGRPSLGQLLELLKARLAVRLPAPVSHIVIDATHSLKVARATSRSHGVRSQSTTFRFAQRELENVLAYCSAAKRARMPLDVLEIINDGSPVNDLVIVAPASGSSKKRLWRDLTGGFVHNGVMRNRAVVEAELKGAAEKLATQGSQNSAERTSLLQELSA